MAKVYQIFTGNMQAHNSHSLLEANHNQDYTNVKIRVYQKVTGQYKFVTTDWTEVYQHFKTCNYRRLELTEWQKAAINLQ